MHPSKPALQPAEPMTLQAFTAPVRPTPLSPAATAASTPRSGAGRYRRHLIHIKWPHRDGSHMRRGVSRRWWHWPVIAALVVLMVGGFILVMSHTAAGDNVSLMLRKLI